MTDTSIDHTFSIQARALLIRWLTEPLSGPRPEHTIKIETESGSTYTVERTPAPCDHLRQTIEFSRDGSEPQDYLLSITVCEALATRNGQPVLSDEGADETSWVWVGLVNFGNDTHLFFKWKTYAGISTPITRARLFSSEQMTGD